MRDRALAAADPHKADLVWQPWEGLESSREKQRQGERGLEPALKDGLGEVGGLVLAQPRPACPESDFLSSLPCSSLPPSSSLPPTMQWKTC